MSKLKVFFFEAEDVSDEALGQIASGFANITAARAAKAVEAEAAKLPPPQDTPLLETQAAPIPAAELVAREAQDVPPPAGVPICEKHQVAKVRYASGGYNCKKCVTERLAAARARKASMAQAAQEAPKEPQPARSAPAAAEHQEPARTEAGGKIDLGEKALLEAVRIGIASRFALKEGGFAIVRNHEGGLSTRSAKDVRMADSFAIVAPIGAGAWVICDPATGKQIGRYYDGAIAPI